MRYARTNRSTLAIALASALVCPLAAELAQAQSAADSYHVIELHHLPASTSSGLDLRPGPYLLQLRGPASGPFEGVLRGPNNEVVSDRLKLTASGCGAGVPSRAALGTRALPARASLDLLQIEIGQAGSGCAMSTSLPAPASVSASTDWQELDCDDFGQTDHLGEGDPGATADPGPQCNEIPLGLTSPVPKPDLKPGLRVSVGGKQALLGAALRLDAAGADRRVLGRCEFSYSYLAHNTGRAASVPTDASLLTGSRLGLQLDRRPLPALAPGAAYRVDGRVLLPTGIWQVYVHLDSQAGVAESNGRNNAAPLVIEVVGSCN